MDDLSTWLREPTHRMQAIPSGVWTRCAAQPDLWLYQDSGLVSSVWPVEDGSMVLDPTVAWRIKRDTP